MVRRLVVAAVLTGALIAPAATLADAYGPGWVDRELALFPESATGGLAVDRDGWITLGGVTRNYAEADPWIRRYLPDGRPDLTFGDAGKADASPTAPKDVAVQSTGRVVILSELPIQSTVLKRLNADGTLDESFSGGGTAGFGLGPRASQLVVQGDDRMVLVDSSGGRLTLTGVSQGGDIDRGFGTHGYASLTADMRGPHVYLVEAPTGQLVLTSSGADPYHLAIFRLSPFGQPDPSFGGGDGVVQLSLDDFGFGPGLAVHPYRRLQPLVLPDGRLRIPVSVRRSVNESRRMALLGLTRSGAPDRRFGDRGLAIGPRPARPGGEMAHTLVADGRGGILAAGDVSHADLGYGNPLLRRFHRTGAVDRAFKASWIGDEFGGMELLDADTLLLAEYRFGDKYRTWGPARLFTVDAAYDTKPPTVAIRVRGCRAARVEVRDRSGVGRVVVRAGGHVLRRTKRSDLVVRVAAGVRRFEVRAADLAGNVSTRTVRLPRC